MLVIRPISQVVGQSQGVRNVTESGRSQFQGSFPHTPNAGEWRARVKNKTKDAMFFRPCLPPHSCCLNWYCNEVLTQYYQEYADFFVILHNEILMCYIDPIVYNPVVACFVVFLQSLITYTNSCDIFCSVYSRFRNKHMWQGAIKIWLHPK